ncbi:MAG: hypothetical protein ACKO8Z_06115 [Prosthecobacter sp.]
MKHLLAVLFNSGGMASDCAEITFVFQRLLCEMACLLRKLENSL